MREVGTYRGARRDLWRKVRKLAGVAGDVPGDWHSYTLAPVVPRNKGKRAAKVSHA